MGFFTHKAWRSIWVGRGAFLFFGLILIVGGLGTLKAGDVHYRNYWGGAVFAPFAITIGVLFLVLLAMNWRTLNKPGPRLKGRAARRARKADVARPANWRPWNP